MSIILYAFGLLKELKNTELLNIIGSYIIDATAWDDLDIDETNENMSKEKLYQ